MQPRILFFDFHCRGKGAFFYRPQQNIALPVIKSTHAVDMLFKVSLADKSSQGILFKIRNCAGIKAQLLIVALQQLRRQHQIADADGRGQAFGKGIQIDNLFRLVNALQRRNRLTQQAELAVIIIFQNIA